MLERNSCRYWINYQQRSEIQYPANTIGHRDLLYKNLFDTIKLRREFMYDYEEQQQRFNNERGPYHGPIYNLAFSNDGSLLFAATENKSLLMFDSLNHKLIKQLSYAHEDSITNIKFLDSRTFATCSDDRNIALWDLRNLKNKLRILRGHTHWVKNIEYDPTLGYLVTASFDGYVNMWDINKYNSESMSSSSSLINSININDQLEPGFVRQSMNDCPYKKILSLSCLLRMRLTNDYSKMIVCTSEGYMLVIHDLNLLTLADDLKEFQSDLYRLMQKGHSSGFDFGSWLNPLFCAERNRVELISDFPDENEAHSINSLEVHPYNWSVLSRNLSRDENSEWTCVHNIQGYERCHEMMSIETPKENIFLPHAMFRRELAQHPEENVNHIEVESNEDSSIQQNLEHSSSYVMDSNHNDLSNINHMQSSSDVHVSPLIIISARTLNRRAHATLLNPNTSYRPIKPGSVPPKIYRNLPRMTNYLEELNVCRRYIKDQCFSSCGRVICSPYEFGFRLLSFNENCSEMCDLMYDRQTKPPQKLFEFKRILCHPNFVITTKFSPTHCLIASGCLSGRVNFYQPVL